MKIKAGIQRSPHTKKHSMFIPNPGQNQKIKVYREMRKRGTKDSIDVTTLEENISVNRPKASTLCKPAMTHKGKELAEELEHNENHRRFNVIKQIIQLPDRPIEWLEIITLERPIIPNLETET